MALDQFRDFIADKIKSGKSCIAIAGELVSTFGNQRGFSERNVQRWCADQGLAARNFCPESRLEYEVARGIEENGPSFGRKLMTGYLSTKGVKASEGRVGRVLRDTHPPYHAARQTNSRNLNPVPYHAEYMGHKMHMDQNEKLVMFGVTHVMAIDGYSKKVVGHCTMPVKNNLRIYEEVYRPAVISYGMWDQVRVDCGREFYLTLYVQEKLAAYRYNQDRQPYLQTPSTRNHVIERMWVEINERVNYPLKRALIQMTDNEELDMEDNLTRYCVSSLACQMAKIGMQNVVNTWNAHRIPGKGIPNQLCGQGSPAKITPDLLPLGEVAANLYEEELGASLTRESLFATDPNIRDWQLAEHEFSSHFPDLRAIHKQVVNENFISFQGALRCLIDTTRRSVV